MGLREWAVSPGISFAARKPEPVQPRRAGTGSSYSSSGLQNVERPPLDEETGSSQPTRLRETVPELATQFQRTQTYGRMMTDAGVDVSMRLYKTPVLGAEFFVEPYGQDPLDLEIQEFISANLFEGMNSPFLNSLEDILHMYEDGFSALEPVYEEREWTPKRKNANAKKYTMLKKLAPRPASSISEILYDDNGGPEGIRHNAIRKDKSVDEVEIPINKLMIFTFNRYGGDLAGKSLLRTAYPHWYYKTHLYKIDSIQKERHAIGVPRGKLLPGFTPSDKNILRRLLRNLRTNEESFVLETPNVEVDFIKLEGTMVDVLESANHHNTMILLNVLGQFVSLGATTTGGGRATGATQSDMFMKSLKYVANQIADEINMYLIPQLVVWNYPTNRFPKLQVRNIGETRDIQMFAAAVANLYGSDALTKGDTATENWLRRQLDAPEVGTSGVDSQAKTNQVSDSGNGNGSGNKDAIPNPRQGNARGETTGYVGKSPNAAS